MLKDHDIYCGKYAGIKYKNKTAARKIVEEIISLIPENATDISIEEDRIWVCYSVEETEEERLSRIFFEERYRQRMAELNK